MNIFSSAGTHVLRKWPQTLPVLRHECWLGCLSTLPQGITQRQSVTTPVIQCQRGLFGKSKWAECSNWTPEKLSRWERFKFKNDLVTLKVDKEVLKKAQGNIFVCCTDFIDYELFIKELDLPNNFLSWFLVLELHVWMVAVKCAQLGPEGFEIHRGLLDHMWSNVETRLKALHVYLERNNYTKILYSTFLESYLYMDEGLLGSDKRLANAIWMTLAKEKHDVSHEALAMMVEYVRKNVHHHDKLDNESFMKTGYISFMPLYGDKLDKQKAETDFITLMDFRGIDAK